MTPQPPVSRRASGQGAHTEPAQALLERWSQLDAAEQLAAFKGLPEGADDDFFYALASHDQADLLAEMGREERRLWLRVLPPDDAADLLQSLPDAARPEWLAKLDDATRREVQALLAFDEDVAGGLMSPRFARLRSEMTVGEAVRYLRKQAIAGLETIYYAYVLDAANRLQGVVSFRDLFSAHDAQPVADIMRRDVQTVTVGTDQEVVARLIAQHDLMAVPVVDDHGVMCGIITVDDVLDVVNEEASEDIHKLGGLEALDLPYLSTSLPEMVKKRGGWLALLFFGELLTASAMSFYEEEIASAVVLALFVPLIISSGGNSGSQAATLVIRAMALGEVGMRDVWRIARRELATGVALGLLLGTLGFARIGLWEVMFGEYGQHWPLIGATVGISLLGVVLWGTLTGSMLPLFIRRLGLDPASASAPFVATLVDVTGLLIYFQVAHVLLKGALL